MKTMGKSIMILFVFAALIGLNQGCSEPGDGGGGSFGPAVLPSGSPETSTPDAAGAASNFFYFSYDDSASTAAVELVKYRLNHGRVPSPSLARPWEFLNFESFDPANPEPLGTFSVSWGLMSRPSATSDAAELHLGVYVRSPAVTLAERQNVVLTLVVDVSGSMDWLSSTDAEISPRKLDVVKYGLNQMTGALKEGDIVNLVTFSNDAKIVLQNVTFSGIPSNFIPAVNALEIEGGTNLAAGLKKGYEVAVGAFDPTKLNRVVMITDAYANIGEVDSTVISHNTRINELEGIYFSGIGVGADFNEAFLNDLTEAGKGAYFTVITNLDAKRALRERFIALASVAARHVQFRLDYPQTLTHISTAAEESSTVQQEVKPTNFSYNTDQYFYEVFSAAASTDPSQRFTLTISYSDPRTLQPVTETITKTLGELLGLQENNIRDAETIFLFTQLVGNRISREKVDNILQTFYVGYSSQLFTEYLDLINKYRNLTAPSPGL